MSPLKRYTDKEIAAKVAEGIGIIGRCTEDFEPLCMEVLAKNHGRHAHEIGGLVGNLRSAQQAGLEWRWTQRYARRLRTFVATGHLLAALVLLVLLAGCIRVGPGETCRVVRVEDGHTYVEFPDGTRK